MIIKCKLCSRENTIDIIEDSIKPYMDTDAGNFKTIAEFDCKINTWIYNDFFNFKFEHFKVEESNQLNLIHAMASS